MPKEIQGPATVRVARPSLYQAEQAVRHHRSTPQHGRGTSHERINFTLSIAYEANALIAIACCLDTGHVGGGELKVA